MEQNRSVNLSGIRFFLMCGVVFTIVFSFFNANSFCIILLLCIWLIEGRFAEKFGLLKKDALFLVFLFYFFIQVIGIFYAEDTMLGIHYVEHRLGFLIVPLMFCSGSFIDEEMRTKVMMVMSLSLVAASLYCLCIDLFRYMHSSDPSVFFYHNFLKPISHHAIYFSIFIFISFISLLHDADRFRFLRDRKWISAVWILYYIFLLVLLSSKLVLFLLLVFLIYFIGKKYGKSRRKYAVLFFIILAASVIILFSYDNPVEKRFTDLFRGNIALLKKDKFDTNTSFTGLEFRLLMWRFTYEILKENHAFLAGVGPADSQPYLGRKYLSMDMYAGDASKGDTGYLGFNCHNQLLQSTLQSGIAGLIAFLGYCFMLFTRAHKKRNIVLTGMAVIIFLLFFTESVFEGQYGMILCTFLPLMYMYGDGRKPSL